jgi:hypothetical protein
MAAKNRKIELPSETADLLEARAALRGLTISELIADLAEEAPLPSHLEELRETGQGPWAPDVLVEDAARLAKFKERRVGVPWAEVAAWMKSWGTANELPPPKPRKL